MTNLTVNIKNVSGTIVADPNSGRVTIGADAIFINTLDVAVGLTLSKKGQMPPSQPVSIAPNQQFRSNLPIDITPGQPWVFEISADLRPPNGTQKIRGNFESVAGHKYTVEICHTSEKGYYLRYTKDGKNRPNPIDNSSAGDTVEFVSNLGPDVPVKVHFSPFTIHVHDVNEVFTIGSGTGSFTFHFSHELSGDWIDPTGKISIRN